MLSSPMGEKSIRFMIRLIMQYINIQGSIIEHGLWMLM